MKIATFAKSENVRGKYQETTNETTGPIPKDTQDKWRPEPTINNGAFRKAIRVGHSKTA